MKHEVADRPKPSLLYVAWNPPVDATWSMRGYALLLRALAQAGWDVSLQTCSTPQNAHLHELWECVPLIKAGRKGTFGGKILFTVQVLRSKADLAWCMVWGWAGWTLLLRRLACGKPYVVWLDGYSHRAPWDATNKLRTLWMELRYGLILRGASMIFAEAPQNLEYTRQALPSSPIRLLSPSLCAKDLDRIEQQWQAEGFAPDREPCVLYSGRLVEHKQVHCLIAAFAALAAEFPDWRLDIRGPADDQAYRQRLEDMVAGYGLQNRVTFYPPVYGEALYRHFRRSSVFCLPSRLEGFPVSILEAMFFGGAIVAAKAGWVEYQLDGGCGLMYASDDQAALTEHLRTLMSSSALRGQLMRKARSRVLSEFIWETRFSEVDAELRRILSRGLGRKLTPRSQSTRVSR